MDTGYYFWRDNTILVQNIFKRVNFDLDAIVRDLLTQPPSLADGKVRSQSY